MQARRDFLKNMTLLTIAPPSLFNLFPSSKEKLFKISLAQWSLHRRFFTEKIDNLDFARIAKEDFAIDAVEYVNQFFKDKAKDRKYIDEMKKSAQNAGVKNLLIMCDGEGRLGDPEKKARLQAVENHYKWVEAAKTLGCHSIRVNAASAGSFAEQQKLAVDGLRRLSEFAQPFGINVIVENHGGLSSDGRWLSAVIKRVDLPACGTLPDFGNFRLKDDQWYDRYKGVQELMPFAKAVSAKTNRFDADGNEIDSDYYRLLKIVIDAGYHGYVGIEYEGDELSEYDGILATKRLLEKVRRKLAG